MTTPEKIAALCHVSPDSVKRAAKADGHYLARKHRDALVAAFGEAVADVYCPVRARKRRTVPEGRYRRKPVDAAKARRELAEVAK